MCFYLSEISNRNRGENLSFTNLSKIIEVKYGGFALIDQTQCFLFLNTETLGEAFF